MKLSPRVALAALVLVAGCHAQQSSSAAGKPASEDTQKRATTAIRDIFSVPPDVNINIGNRATSEFAGYDTLPVTFQRAERVTTVPFLISKDGKTLARLEKIDLTSVKLPEELAKEFLTKQPEIVAGRPVKGNPNAPVTIVSFDDFQCPYCARMHQTLFPGVFDQYKDKIKVIYVDYPLVSIHPWAMHAAVAANCLVAQGNGDFGAYWDFSDRVHSSQQEINAPHDLTKAKAEIDRIAREIAGKHNIAVPTLNECIAKDDQTSIQKSIAEGEKLNLNSTPTLYVNGVKLEGAVPEFEVKRVIDEALKQAGTTTK